MHEITLDIQNDGLALILISREGGEPRRLATVYRMKDGWHTKMANEHTRRAWTGPFASAEDAFEALKASVSTLA